jgi:hypothetical protein
MGDTDIAGLLKGFGDQVGSFAATAANLRTNLITQASKVRIAELNSNTEEIRARAALANAQAALNPSSPMTWLLIGGAVLALVLILRKR